MEKEFLEIQNRLRGQVVQTDQFKTDEISLVAGVDVAYWNGEDSRIQVPTRFADILTHQRRTSLKSGLN